MNKLSEGLSDRGIKERHNDMSHGMSVAIFERQNTCQQQWSQNKTTRGKPSSGTGHTAQKTPRRLSK